MRSYSALTSDIQRDPTILQAMKLEAWALDPWRDLDVTVTVHGPVTTVMVVLP